MRHSLNGSRPLAWPRRCKAGCAVRQKLGDPAQHPVGVGYTQLELWDSNGTVAGGQFVVNGTPQTGGHEIDVTPANVASTVLDVGTAGGTDTLWAQLLQSDGQLTGWEQFTVTAPTAQLPTLAVSSRCGRPDIVRACRCIEGLRPRIRRSQPGAGSAGGV